MSEEVKVVEEDPILVVTDKMVVEFLTKVGGYKRVCPNCKNEDMWDSPADDSDPNRAVIRVRESMVGSFSVGTYVMHCGNCGFLETYAAKPAVDYWFGKDA